MKICSASFCIFLHNGTYAGKLHENNSAVFGAQNHGSGSPLGMAFDGQAAASKPLLQGITSSFSQGRPAVPVRVVQPSCLEHVSGLLPYQVYINFRVMLFHFVYVIYRHYIKQ